VVRKRVLLVGIGEGIVRSKNSERNECSGVKGELNWESKPKGGHW